MFSFSSVSMPSRTEKLGVIESLGLLEEGGFGELHSDSAVTEDRGTMPMSKMVSRASVTRVRARVREK